MYHNTITSDEAKSLRDLIVTFKVDNYGLLEIEQVEINCSFTGFGEILDLKFLGKSAKARIEDICTEYYNNNLWKTKSLESENV